VRFVDLAHAAGADRLGHFVWTKACTYTQEHGNRFAGLARWWLPSRRRRVYRRVRSVPQEAGISPLVRVLTVVYPRV
jgi:hypothetical protein